MFLQLPPTLLEYELMPEFKPMPEPEPLLVYEPLLEFEPMSPDLPLLELIFPKVPAIEISSIDSPTSALDLFESDLSEVTSVAAS